MFDSRQRTPSQTAYGQSLRLYGLIQRAMRPYFQQFGLSQAQWAILRVLYRAQEEGRTSGLRMSEIGQQLLVQPPSVTTLVRRLVNAGLACQSTAPNDRRGSELRLTNEGEILVKRVLLGHQQQICEVMGGLDEAELPVFNNHLAKLNSRLAAIAAKTSDSLD